jgi:hypothetical protein
MESRLDKNKQNAIAFYKMAYEGEPSKACAQFVGDEYIQHNPLVGDGTKPLIVYFEKMAEEYANKSIWGMHLTKLTTTSCGYRFLVSGMFACIYRKRGLDFLKILETLCHNPRHYI